MLSRTARILASACVVVLLLCGGCRGWTPARPVPADWAVHPGPFAPESLKIDPLTRVERGPGGDPRLVLHVQLADRWGDQVKGVGEMRVRLLRPQGDANSEREQVAWEIDLRNADENMKRYDPTTRTYSIVLGDLPPWAVERTMVDDIAGGEGLPPRVSVVLATPAPDGSTRYLQDEADLPAR